MPCGKRKRKRSSKTRRKRSRTPSMTKMMGDTAKLAIGATATVAVTSLAVNALKR